MKRAVFEPLESRTLLSGSLQYLQNTQNQYATQTYVYDDAGSAGNHFLALAEINSSGAGDSAAVGMNEYWTGGAEGALPQSGQTAINCTFTSLGDSNWGGFIFQNGVLPAGATSPQFNWGTVPNAGVNLSGATSLTFWLRGDAGGEQVQCFAFGIGYNNAGQATAPYPDSSPKVSTPVLTLSTTWTQYSINLTGLSLNYVLGGFGWVAASQGKNISFEIDNVAYNVPDNSPHLLVSYQTQNTGEEFDTVMKSVSYVYDNDLAAIAMLESGDVTDATQIANSLVLATQNDPTNPPGQIRNAYTGGDLTEPPGWLSPSGTANTVRTAGWYDPTTQMFDEDPSQMGFSTGTLAWTMIALSRMYQATSNKVYLSTAEELGTFAQKHCRGTGAGYTAGMDDPGAKLNFKSSEQNIDMYVADKLLFTITHAGAWNTRANSAYTFVMSMLNKTKKGPDFFWGGTNANGKGINKGVIPVDVQALAVMAFGVKKKTITGGLTFADSNMKSGSGYSFSNADISGTWSDGTAMMSLAKGMVGDASTSQSLLEFLHSEQSPDGGLIEASKDNLVTGYDTSEGQPFNLFAREAVSSTSWLAFAEMGYNPMAI